MNISLAIGVYTGYAVVPSRYTQDDCGCTGTVVAVKSTGTCVVSCVSGAVELQR